MSLKIQFKDALIIAIVAIIAVGAFLASYLLDGTLAFGTLIWGVPVTILLVLLFGLILEERRRKQERHQQLSEALNNTYSQIEALISVRSELEIDGDLPTTRGWAASPDFLQELTRIIRTRNPQQVVEAGSGVSTIVTALALRKKESGNIVALENGSEFAKKTRSYLEHHDLKKYANVVHAPLTKHARRDSKYVWYDTTALKDCGSIDLLIVDGPPALQDSTARFPVLPLLWDQLSPNAVILIDDGDRQGEQEIVERWCEDYNLESTYFPLEEGAYLLKRTTQ